MSGERPGPICGSKRGSHWIDSGTLIRSRSGAPGPLGMLMSLVMGAAPGSEEEKQRKSDQQAMFTYDIDEIEKARIPDLKDKAAIVAELRSLNENFLIQYGETLNDSRGDWDGSIIRINENYDGKIYPTMIELVHEGTHALTTKQNSGKGGKAKKTSNAEEELQSQKNQLLMYVYLRDTKKYEDPEMDQRLQNLSNGTLKKNLEEKFKKP
jgi:hypothetical protein